jgi:hypothetical protein
MKTMLDNQQKVNEAVKEITDYFMHVTYEDDLELMFSAQTQIVGLMELAKQQMINSHGHDELNFITNDITTFLQTVREYLHMLKPFAKMVE